MNIGTIVQMIEADPSIPSDIDGFVARMNAKTNRHERHDTVTTAILLKTYGMAKTMDWIGALKTAGLGDLIGSLDSGWDFAAAETQAQLDWAISQGLFSAEDGAVLKALGVWFTSQAEDNGGECTRANVEAAVAIIAKKPLLAEAAQRYQNVVAAVESGQATDTAGMVAKFGEAV